jgi:hypothetical protein
MGLLLVLVLAALFRFYGNLEQVPPAFFPDEANMALDAQSILGGQFYLITPHEGGEGSLYAYLLALVFGLFGPGISQARMLTAMLSVISAGAAFVFMYYLLHPRMGQWPALGVSTFTGLGLAVSYWYVAVSRQAFPQPLAVLVQVACLGAVWWSLHSGFAAVSVVAGVLLGLTAYTYVPGKLTPLLLLAYFLLDWVARGRRSFFRQHLQRLSIIALIGGLFYAPLVATFASRSAELRGRAGQFTFLSPTISRGDPLGTLFRSTLGNVAGFLPSLSHVGGHPIAKAMDDLTAMLFLIGLILVLWRWRQPEFLLLPVWWAVMLVPSIIAPEGAVPHLRRAIGTAVPAFALAGLGLITPLTAIARSGRAWRRLVAITGVLIIAVLSVTLRARYTYANYYLRTLNDEAVALTNHIYDFELAEVMAAEGDRDTGYVLPVDSASGALYPESSTLAFLYRGPAAYAYIWDDEITLFDALEQLANGKARVGVIRWKVSKHTGADPKRVFDYALHKWGTPDTRTQHHYFDVDYFDSNPEPIVISPAPLDVVNVQYEDDFVLTGAAMAESVAADDLLWVELAWRKSGASSQDYQVALWLEDNAGHQVGQVDKPLLNNLWHQGTGEWEVGVTERDYYLVPIDPTTLPGTYRLKTVIYADDDGGRRLAPTLSGVGADLGVTLGEVPVTAPLAPLDLAALPIPQRSDLEVGDELRLVGFDPGFIGPLRPGDRGTLSLWWQATAPSAKNLVVMVGMGQGEKTWAVSGFQPLGDVDFPVRSWPTGAVVRTFIDVRLPPDLETGTYNLGIRLLNGEDDTTAADWVLGQMQVMGRTRDFEVPPITHQVEANLGGQVTLLGYDSDLSRVGQGDPVHLTLYWQAQREMETAYKVFVHLLDGSQNIVAQVDQEPQRGEAPTTGWLANEVVVDPIEFSAPEGIATVESIAVGLYAPYSGERVPLLNAEAIPIGDHVTLPVP